MVLLFLLLICKILYAFSLRNTYPISDLIDNVLHETKPHQVALINPKYENQSLPDNRIKNFNLITKCLLIKTASILIENLTEENYEHLEEYYSLFGNSRRTTLFVIILHDNNEHESLINALVPQFKETLEFLMLMLPSTTRPYCLFIISVRKYISTDFINLLLHYAWEQKFLDVTIIQSAVESASCENNLLFQFYNPFIEHYYADCYLNERIIFPNKLLNMNKYLLKVSILSRPPMVNIERNSSGHPININGSDYGIMKLLSEKMNFSIQWIAPKITSYAEPVSENHTNNLLELIVFGEIDCSGNQLYLHYAMKNYDQRHGERSLLMWVDEMVALVPIYPSPIYRLQLSSLYILLHLFLHTGVMYLIAKILKFDIENWLPHHVLQIMVGNPAPKLPKRLVERLAFVSLFVLSQKYSVSLYARLTDIRWNLSDEGPFRTLSDLGRSDIMLEANGIHINMTFENDDPVLKSLRKKVKIVNDTTNCPSRIFKYRNVSCLLDHSIARSHLNILQRDRSLPPRMKILDHKFWAAPKGYIFSEASPYVPQFNNILQVILQSGLWRRWFIYQKIPPKSSILCEDLHAYVKFLKPKLIMLLCSGCLVALIAFISEFIVYRLKEF